MRRHRGLSKAAKEDFASCIVLGCSARFPLSYFLEENYRDVYPLIKPAIRIFISSRDERRPFPLRFNQQELHQAVRYLWPPTGTVFRMFVTCPFFRERSALDAFDAELREYELKRRKTSIRVWKSCKISIKFIRLQGICKNCRILMTIFAQ